MRPNVEHISPVWAPARSRGPAARWRGCGQNWGPFL